MMAQRSGSIINLSSMAGKTSWPASAEYSSSKSGVIGLTRSVAMELAPYGATANAVCPGVTSTAMNDRRLEYDAQRLGRSFAELEAEASPLGRRLTPEEIAAAVVFLAGEAAGAINGQLINVCGGRVIC